MGQGITSLDYIVVAVYCVGLLLVALYHSHKMERRDDVYLAGRSMSRWPIAISMYMALFSTNTFLGVTGWVNRPSGSVWIGVQTFGIMAAVPLVVFLYPALFFRLRITSAYEYLEYRFSPAVRSVATLFFLAARFMWMGTMMYSASLVVSMMLGWTGFEGTLWGVLGMGALSMLFTLLGGMHSVIWTDVVQFFVLLAGLTAIIIFGLDLCGGIGEVLRIGAAAGKFTPPSVFSLTDELSVLGGFLLGFFGMLSSSGADQVVLQQYLTAKSEKEAKAALWRNGLYLKPISLIYPFVGLILFAYYHTHPEIAQLVRVPDDALPVFVVNVLPPGMRGLMSVAMIAAVLTSVQSGLAAVSAAIQVNFVQSRMARKLSDRQSVVLARGILLASGTVILLVSLVLRQLGQKNSIIQILNIVMWPFSGVLLGIFLLGILSQRVTARGALTGGVIGFLATIAAPASKLLIASNSAWPLLAQLGRISDFYYVFLGTAVTLVFGYAASLAGPPPPKEKIEGLTRWSLPQSVAAETVSIRGQ